MATATIEPGQIYGLITDIKKAAGALGKTKTQGINFPFRGIDGTVNHLAAHIEEVGVITVPNVISHEVTEREDAKGRVVKTSIVEVEYTFYAPDGSSVSATTAGIADDYADRSSAQAQSVAFRIALLQVFFLPTQAPEPEVTGGKAQEQRATPAQSKIEQAKKVAAKPTAKAEPKSKDTIRTEYIDKGVVEGATVNAMVAEAKQNGLTGDAVFDSVLEKLQKGEV